MNASARQIKSQNKNNLSARDNHVEAFKALGQLSRLRLFFFLVKKNKEISVGELQKKFKIPGSTLSHHLDLLYRTGLVERRKEERFLYYSVNRPMVSDLVRILTSCC